jgi:sugar lactone lactonase YvrE
MQNSLRGIVLIVAVLICADARAATIWASGSTPSRIYRIDSATGALLGSFNGPGSFSDAVVVDNSGTFLHIADSSPGSTSRIWRTSTIGAVISSFTVPYDLEGMTQLANGNLVLANATNSPPSIVTVNPTTGAVISSFTTGGVSIFGLDTDGTSEIYGLQGNGVINRYSLGGTLLGSITTAVSTGNALGLASTGTSFYIVDALTNVITEVTTSGAFIRSFPTPGGTGGFVEGLDYVVPEPSTAVAMLALLASMPLARKLRRR